MFAPYPSNLASAVVLVTGKPDLSFDADNLEFR